MVRYMLHAFALASIVAPFQASAIESQSVWAKFEEKCLKPLYLGKAPTLRGWKRRVLRNEPELDLLVMLYEDRETGVLLQFERQPDMPISCHLVGFDERAIDGLIEKLPPKLDDVQFFELPKTDSETTRYHALVGACLSREAKTGMVVMILQSPADSSNATFILAASELRLDDEMIKLCRDA